MVVRGQPSAVLSAVMVISIVSVIVVSALITVGQLSRERAKMEKEARYNKTRRLRYKDTCAEVIAPTLTECAFHLFLSHVYVPCLCVCGDNVRC